MRAYRMPIHARVLVRRDDRSREPMGKSVGGREALEGVVCARGSKTERPVCDGVCVFLSAGRRADLEEEEEAPVAPGPRRLCF